MKRLIRLPFVAGLALMQMTREVRLAMNSMHLE
jgi:hypothetical protein